MRSDNNDKNKGDMEDIAKLNRKKMYLCTWLDKNWQDILEREESEGQNYVAIIESPPKQVFLFPKKNDLMRFLQKHKVSAYRYRHSDEIIKML